MKTLGTQPWGKPGFDDGSKPDIFLLNLFFYIFTFIFSLIFLSWIQILREKAGFFIGILFTVQLQKMYFQGSLIFIFRIQNLI